MTDSRKHDLTTVYGRLKFLTDTTGRTESEIVEKTGISQSTVNAALTGARKNPSIKTLGPIAEYLGANLVWVAEGRGEPFQKAKSYGVSDAAQDRLLLAGIKQGLILAGIDPDSPDFHRKVTTAFDKAKADLAARGNEVA